jgi:hypothetical protein
MGCSAKSNSSTLDTDIDIVIAIQPPWKNKTHGAAMKCEVIIVDHEVPLSAMYTTDKNKIS